MDDSSLFLFFLSKKIQIFFFNPTKIALVESSVADPDNFAPVHVFEIPDPDPA